MLDQSISISGQFDKVSLETWKKSVSEMIGADADEKLTLKSIEGIEIKPLHTESIHTIDLNSYPSKSNIVKHDLNSGKKNIDSTKIHNAGASIVQEVAFIFDQFVQSLNESEVHIHISCDSLYFSNISKVRAVRFGLERIIEESSSKTKFKIICHNSLREQTLFDPWVNMLRSTSSSMAAIIGGADCVSSFSYDQLFCTLTNSTESNLGRRQADNILKILIEESHLDRIHDPMKGSYVVDNLSYQILQKSWNMFSGGIDLKSLSEEVKKVSDKRYALAQSRKLTITGVNNFANPEETLESIYKFKNSISFKEAGDFPLRHLSREFDELRLSLKKDINIQVAMFGTEAKLSARMNFCKNYFELLGQKVETLPASIDIDALVNSFEDKKGECVIICAEDKDYPENGQKLIDAFKASTSMIYIAGKPKDQTFQSIKDQLYMGQNVFNVLSRFVQEVNL